MANVKKGNLTAPPQWWKHLRDWKRVFWKSERRAHKGMMPYRVQDDYSEQEFYADFCTADNPCPACRQESK